MQERTDAGQAHRPIRTRTARGRTLLAAPLRAVAVVPRLALAHTDAAEHAFEVVSRTLQAYFGTVVAESA